MQEELIESEKQMVKSNIKLLTKRLNYLLENGIPNDNNIFDKTIYDGLINEIEYNVKTEIENYLILL